MKRINGSLDVMPVTDIIQWAHNNKRTGTLIFSQEDRQKKFYLQNGEIIYVWSNCDGGNFAHFFEHQLLISPEDLSKALAKANLLGLPFIRYLLSENFFTKEHFEETLWKSVEAVLINALGWETGLFEFVSELPDSLLDSPVRLNSFQILMESMQFIDESRRGGDIDAAIVMNKINFHIQQDTFDLPPIPDVMQQISEKMNDPDISIHEIVSCITDQILVSKILKICNSPYYGRVGGVSTLKDAVIIIGLKSLLSIVTVHAMSSFSPRNEEEIKKVLQHSLVCGMIARQITRDIRGNFELAFICGLLHDIGKTILLDMLCDYKLQPIEKERLIKENHAEVGYLLAKKWNFGDDIKAVIRYHHTPEHATGYFEITEVVSLANTMAHLNAHPIEKIEMSFPNLDLPQASIDDLLEKVVLFDHEADDILCFT